MSVSASKPTDHSRTENGQKHIIEGFAETEAGIAMAGNDHVRDQDSYEKGDLDAGMISCGQGIGLTHDIPTVKELFDRMIAEAVDIMERLTARERRS